MPANTVTVKDILFEIAHLTGMVRAEFVSTVVSPTVLTLNGISNEPREMFKGAYARVPNKGVRKITDFDYAAQRITIESQFTGGVTADEVVEICSWLGMDRAVALGAIQDAIRESYPSWYREVVIDRNTSVDSLGVAWTPINVNRDIDTYALPADAMELGRVGIQRAATDEPMWFDPLNIWRVTGQPGDKKVRFLRSRRFDFVDQFHGEVLCFHYAAREPVPATETDSTQLPMEFFRYAAYLFAMRRLLMSPDADLQKLMLQQFQEKGANIALAELMHQHSPVNNHLLRFIGTVEQSAQTALARVGAVKPEFRSGITLGK